MELSWLPGVRLTRAQAYSGMVLDDFVSDPQRVTDAKVFEQAAAHAAELGMSLSQAVVRLYKNCRSDKMSQVLTAASTSRTGRVRVRCGAREAANPHPGR
ncbi:hypothetical protein [Nocardia pseudobrasiliensis]|uniref:Uncharacterized protein n=1 Tax=Nocardia pseudobrasiliensis TaxID=45979 RepID=A0A370HYW1_9NOCA|nr:hypothetical protein [Nocardia pseudobrasiliensis]RDI63510.1 hypothetical protein DFR76_110207 [Nocardia pseudobrasiliensis]